MTSSCPPPPTGSSSSPTSRSRPPRPPCRTSPRSASRICTCPPCWRPCRAPRTATTSSTTRGCGRSWAARRGCGRWPAPRGRTASGWSWTSCRTTWPWRPRHNRALWEVLREGPESPYARWFDIDWEAQGGQVLLPVLGGPLGDGARASCAVDGRRAALLRPRVPAARGHREAAAAASCWTPSGTGSAWWRLARTELNYRRFFTISELIGVRVEDPEVFDATHAKILELLRRGCRRRAARRPPGRARRPRRLSAAAARGDRRAAGRSSRRSSPDGERAAGRLAGGGHHRLRRAAPRRRPVHRPGGRGRAARRSTGGSRPRRATGAATGRRRCGGPRTRWSRTSWPPRLDRLTRVAHARRARVPGPGAARPRALGAAHRAARAAGAHGGLPAVRLRGDAAARRHRGGRGRGARRRSRCPRRPRPWTWCGTWCWAGSATGRSTRSSGRGSRRPRPRCAPSRWRTRRSTAMCRCSRRTRWAATRAARPCRRRTSTPTARGVQRDWPATGTVLSTHDTKRSADVRAAIAVLTECPRAVGRRAGAR